MFQASYYRIRLNTQFKIVLTLLTLNVPKTKKKKKICYKGVKISNQIQIF